MSPQQKALINSYSSEAVKNMRSMHFGGEIIKFIKNFTSESGSSRFNSHEFRNNYKTCLEIESKRDIIII